LAVITSARSGSPIWSEDTIFSRVLIIEFLEGRSRFCSKDFHTKNTEEDKNTKRD